MNRSIVLDNELGFRPVNTTVQDSSEPDFVQLHALLEVSRNLNATLDLNKLLETIIEVAAEVTDAEAASILLLDETTGELQFEAATGVKKAEVKSVTVPLEGSIAGWIILNNHPQMISNAHQDPRHFAKVDHKTQFNTQSLLGVPLRIREKTTGVVEVLNKRGNRDFARHDIKLLETLSAQAAVAIDNARLYKDLQNQVQVLQEAQVRLRQSEKLAAVGELVTGVAYELNSPLTSIIGFAELMALKDMDAESRQDLDRIITQGQRAAGIARSLLNFTQPHRAVQKPVQINDLLENTIAEFTHEFRTHNIALQTDLLPNLPFTTGDLHLLQQAFAHLIHNANQAMSKDSGSGQLAIATELGPSIFHDRPAENHSVIRITIRDNGPGIPADYLSRIFSPFFTTKRPEEGIGLGLSISSGIISGHGGYLWAKNESDQGVTFFIELPITTSALQGRPTLLSKGHRPQDNQEDAIYNGSVRVLVVADDKNVLATLNQALQTVGYQADTVTDGKVALACLAEVDYDLILYDMDLSSLSGYELYRWAQKKKLNIAQRIIFITDEALSLTAQHFLHKTNILYLSKSLDSAELIDNVRKVSLL